MKTGQPQPAPGADAGQPPQVMVAVDDVCRTFGSGHTAVHALRGVSFTLDRGQLVALRGRSGSGKTTLLNIIGGLDDPTAGRVWVDGREVNRLTERERLAMRRDRVAFIFQAFGLVPMLSAAENVGIPLRIAGLRPRERRERVAAMLALTGLSSHAAHRPDELSGGQQQRVAVARALAARPGLLIADEPTSQLDLENGRQIMELLLSLVRSEGVTALVATHDEALVGLADKVIVLDDGSVGGTGAAGRTEAGAVGTEGGLWAGSGCPFSSAGPGPRGCSWPASWSRSCSSPGSRPLAGLSRSR
ncbi:MAG TPA: ABC transporter ATP-binding protein [Trebonia sp.]|jgi:putative ABC transport system ATP-binding protein